MVLDVPVDIIDNTLNLSSNFMRCVDPMPSVGAIAAWARSSILEPYEPILENYNEIRCLVNFPDISKSENMAVLKTRTESPSFAQTTASNVCLISQYSRSPILKYL